MKPALTPERLDRALATTATVFEVPRREIIGGCRLFSIVRARHALYAALYQACETSYPELSRYVRRDKATVYHGVQSALLMASDPDYAALVARIAEAAR